MQSSTKPVFYFIVILIACSCTAVKNITQPTVGITALKFISEYDIPYNLVYKGTTVGGLSGIDYNAQQNNYYLISDDRSDRNPARFYTASVFFGAKGIDSLQFTGVTNMLQPGGAVYPNNKQDPYHTPDPESIRYNPINRQLVWSSEGERIVKGKDTILENPTIIRISKNGQYRDSFQLPANLYMHATENGPRQNGVLEGLTFADNYKTLFVSVEEPLYEDGPRADVADNNAYIRLFKFDVAEKKSTIQYAYKLAAVAYPPVPASAFKLNGVSEIMSIGNNQLLVIERSFSTGRQPCTIRVFIANLNGATDISNLTLKDNNNFIPASKKLLLNMDDLGIYVDNIEGVCFGPVLPNGHKTLLFVADNNFNILQRAQLLLFEVLE